MNKYLIQLFLKEHRIILPGFGSLLFCHDNSKEIHFRPDLNVTDDTLTNYIVQIEAIEVQNAQNTIAKFIREIESNLNKGESFDIFEFGSFKKNEVGKIEFFSWLKEDVSQREESPVFSIEPAEIELKVEMAQLNDLSILHAMDENLPIEQTTEIENFEVLRPKLPEENYEINSVTDHEIALSLIKRLLAANEEQIPSAKAENTSVSNQQQSQTIQQNNIQKIELRQSENSQKKHKKFPFWFFFILSVFCF